jgi:hypothetical protein
VFVGEWVLLLLLLVADDLGDFFESECDLESTSDGGRGLICPLAIASLLVVLCSCSSSSSSSSSFSLIDSWADCWLASKC